MIPLSECFISEAQGPFESLIFSAIYMAQLFYTFGAFMYMGSVAQTEKVEVPKFPKLDADWRTRPVVMMIRYAFRGIRGDNAWDCMIQDIRAKVVHGRYHVSID